MPESSSSAHRHRSGSLRQSNKKNKRSKSSKRSITRAAGGKLGGKSAASAALLQQQSKADRKHHQLQRRQAKKEDRLWRWRLQCSNNNNNGKSSGIATVAATSYRPPPPRLIGIVSLGHSSAVEEKLRWLLTQQARGNVIDTKQQRQQIYSGKDLGLSAADMSSPSSAEQARSTSSVTVHYPVHKETLTILTASSAFEPHYKNGNYSDEDAAVLAALDLCRVCEMILFVIDSEDEDSAGSLVGMQVGDSGKYNSSSGSNSSSNIGREWDHLISERGDRILSAVKAQGLPTPLTILAHHNDNNGDNSDWEARIDNDDDDKMDQMTLQSAKSLRRSNLKQQQSLKRFATRFATTEFGTSANKVMEVDLTTMIPTTTTTSGEQDVMDEENDEQETVTRTLASSRTSAAAVAALVRTLCTMGASPPKWVSELPRPLIVSDCYHYDAIQHQLHITGHVRSRVPLSVNSLFHVPNVGTFQCQAIRKATFQQGNQDSKTTRGIKRASFSVDQVMDEEVDDKNYGDDTILANLDIQESLNMFATPNSLEGEQNLIGFDEDEEEKDANDEVDDTKKGFARPAGWSDYQSAWLDAADADQGEILDSAADQGEVDHGELARELNQKDVRLSMMDSKMDLDDANHASASERSMLLAQRRKDQADHRDFPDEVQVGDDDKARERFARYRALKSFRKSQWDPKENLPESYASIYHFANFKATQRNILEEVSDRAKAADARFGHYWGTGPNSTEGDADMPVEGDDDEVDILEGCVPTGAYITLTLSDVSKDDYAGINTNGLIAAVAILPHENKVSVLHMGLSRLSGCVDSHNAPIKSKDVLTFRCGWKTWTARPVFSQNNLNCDKHKFERYLPPEGSFFAASVFGPVTYTPSPVLVFRESNGAGDSSSSTSIQLLAMGSMIGADADRIVVKRIVLTGYPVRVQKRFATVKYMFYNPDDVRWFKPADLTTKHGLNGNILDSVGEHGTMKCLFNAPIKQHDTVCLPLYKRIYPKFVASSEGGISDRSSVRSTRTTNHKLSVK